MTLIVGAGPIGLYAAALLKNTTVIDQKKRIGHPIRCTGILTGAIKELLSQKEIKKITLNTIEETTIHGPTTTATLPISKDYIICNTTFEELLADKAAKNGTDIQLQTKYISSTNNKHTIRTADGTKKTICKETLIGADGPDSQVRKKAGIPLKHKHYEGYQIRLKVKAHENKIQFYPHIGSYAWYVPESKTVARVGVCAPKNAKKIGDEFIKRFKGRTLETQGGFIPYHTPTSLIQKKNATLLGDAGGMIKNTTGGGIIPGMRSAKQFANTGKPSSTPLRAELLAHFLVHNALKKCTHKEWDAIIKRSTYHVAKFQKINRDQAYKLLFRLSTDSAFLKIGIKNTLLK